MDQFVNSAYNVTSQLFGPDSGIPWWAWVIVPVAILWKTLFPERQTTEERDAVMVAALVGDDGGTKGKKDRKKSKKK